LIVTPLLGIHFSSIPNIDVLELDVLAMDAFDSLRGCDQMGVDSGKDNIHISDRLELAASLAVSTAVDKPGFSNSFS